MNIHIKNIEVDKLEKVVEVLNHIPEFDAVFYREKLAEHLQKYDSILLIAEYTGKPIACILAYNRYFDGSVYAWLGGVLPPFRKQGIATLLQEELEAEARKRFFRSIRMKTRNQHTDMLRFALKHGFQVCGFEANERLGQARVELVKGV